MKKILLLLASLGSFGLLSAQIDLGGKAGSNYYLQNSALSDNAPLGTPAIESTNGFGFHVGAFAEFILSEKLFLRPELLYGTRSSSSTINSDVTIFIARLLTEQEIRNTLSYAELPVLLGLRISEQFSLQLGPALGVLINSNTKIDGTTSVTFAGQTITTEQASSSSSKEGLRPLEFAGVVGIGYRMENGVDIGLRYWRGFNTLNEDTAVLKTSQSMVQFSLGYAFLKN